MNNDQFLDGVKAILKAQFYAFSPTVLEEKKFTGRGAYLTAEVAGLLLLFTLEYGIDFVLEVASPALLRKRTTHPKF